MNLPEPVAHMLNGGYAFEMSREPYHCGPEWDALYTEDQLREELARQSTELKQLQEQNRWLDAKLASHEAVMRQAIELIGPQAPECCGCATEWNAAIKALEDALK